MKLILNTNPIELNSPAQPSVADLLTSRGIAPRGIAVALNNKVVRRADWPVTLLNEGDHITIITAICGG